MTIDEIAAIITGHRFLFTNEKELQDGLALILPAHSREVRLNNKDIIDFVVSDIGIEVKVDGSFALVARQLHRYSQTELQGLILVTTRSKHRAMPDTLNGKPLRTIWLGNAF